MKLNNPYRTVEYFWIQVLKHRKWSIEDRLAALEEITLESLQNFISYMLSTVFIEGIIHGNITKVYGYRYSFNRVIGGIPYFNERHFVDFPSAAASRS